MTTIEKQQVISEINGLRAQLLVVNEGIGKLEAFVRSLLMDNANLSMGMLIEDLPWSQRAKNCLRRAKIETVEDLVNYPYEKLKKIKALGTGTLKEIEKELRKGGLKLV